MTHEKIIMLFDNNPNMTLKELARITGYSVAELKAILMGAN